MLFESVLLGGLLGCGLVSATFAQGERWVVAGVVLDHERAALGAAELMLQPLNGGAGWRVTSDATGAFRFAPVGAGAYRLTVRATGFAVQELPLTLTADQQQLELLLRPAALAAEVLIAASEIAGNEAEQLRIPGSVNVVDARTLEVTRPFNFNEALRRVPGVYTREEDGFGLRPSIGLRGLDPNRSAKVLLLEDGVPLGHAPYGDTDAYYHPPIERFNGIEVVKGSGQIAYGPNTLGGLINYLTPNPPERLSGSLTLLGGNQRYFNGFGSVGATLGKGAGQTGFVLDVLRKQGAGARDHIFSQLSDYLVKTQTRLDQDGAQSLSTKLSYYGERSNVPYAGLTEAEYAQHPRGNPFRDDRFHGDRFGGAFTYANALNAHTALTATAYFSRFSRDWWRQSSNSDQRPNRLGRNGCTGLAVLNTRCGNEGRMRDYQTFGFDPRLKVTSHWGESDFGLRYHRETQQRIQQNNDTLGPLGRTGVTVEDNERQNEAYAGYAQHRFNLGKWAVTPGLRMERVAIRRWNRLAAQGAGASGEMSLTQWIPGLGIAYQLGNGAGEGLTIFAGAHRGFAPPRPSDIIDNNSGGIVELEPERSWNYELGVRTSPLRGWKAGAALFRLDYQNQIVPANLSGGTGTLLTSAGRTLHQGIELDTRLDTGALRNSPHNVYVQVAYTWVGLATYRGTRFSSVSGFSNISIRGNRLIYAPEHLATVTLGYSHPRGLEALLEAVHTSQQFSDDLNTFVPSPNGQRGLIPAYTVWNATLNYRFGGHERVAPTAFMTVKNLANDTFIVDRRRGLMPGIPRLLQAGIKFRF